MKRIAVYIRVSTKEQTPDLQIDELLDYCQRKGWAGVNVCIYLDSSSRGRTMDRPALKQLMQDVHQRKVDVVVTWRLDRLFRSLKHLVNTLTDWQGQGIEYISLRDGIDLTTATGKLMMQLMGAFAEFESNLISERVSAGLRAAKVRGRRIGAKPKLSPAQRSEASTLRASGLTLSEIGRWLGVDASTILRALK